MAKIGIIGGSGLDDPQLLKDSKNISVETPYGKPTSDLTTGYINGKSVVIIARHGKHHTHPPTQVNFRANIDALKSQDCTHILATTACGSLRQEIKRGDLVILDQFIDFTRFRAVTFYDKFEPGAENAKHTPMADPFSADLRQKLISAAKGLDFPFHERGTVITIEGPRFSTRAESRMFQIWGADVINMSVAPEAILANEAGIPYAAVAMSTDYDCWKTDEAPVEWSEILNIFGKNVENVKKLLLKTIESI
ncbi:MAG: methylthioadenosine phosphorylase [Lentisphaerae bacterium RIFOXYA12_FULL_48_11]|nr:MAG: methylthioadenosine phosphorylase [Lentisphaerae bacterium RIFOXYA12_FULL_48_11]